MFAFPCLIHFAHFIFFGLGFKECLHIVIILKRHWKERTNLIGEGQRSGVPLIDAFVGWIPG